MWDQSETRARQECAECVPLPCGPAIRLRGGLLFSGRKLGLRDGPWALRYIDFTLTALVLLG